MPYYRRLSQAAVLAALSIVASACSQDGTSSPTGPSTAGRRGAVIDGRVTGIASRATAPGVSGTMATSSVTVTIAGTDISTVVDGDGDFTLTGVPPGDVQLRFAGNGVNATVTLTGVQATDHITVRIALNGNGARLESEHRGRNDDEDDDDEDEDNDELKGAVSGLSGTCPALTFTVKATTVKTNSSTRFDNGLCTRIANGTRVEVKGTRQSDGSLLAARVERDD